MFNAITTLPLVLTASAYSWLSLRFTYLTSIKTGTPPPPPCARYPLACIVPVPTRTLLSNTDISSAAPLSSSSKVGCRRRCAFAVLVRVLGYVLASDDATLVARERVGSGVRKAVEGGGEGKDEEGESGSGSYDEWLVRPGGRGLRGESVGIGDKGGRFANTSSIRRVGRGLLEVGCA
jgi:hypothetical protein